MSQTITLEASSLWLCAARNKEQTETSPSDYRLAQRVASGDMQAFEELYLLYHRRVYNLCLRMTCNEMEAEDLTQEIFIHAYRKIGSFRGDSAMMT